MGPRCRAPHCTLNIQTWEVTDELEGRHTTFSEGIDDALSDLEEDEVGQESIAFEGGAKEELLATMRVKDDLEFGKGDAASRASGFEGSVGNSTHASASSRRMAVEKEVNKMLQAKATALEKEAEKHKQEMKIMQERMRSMAAACANRSEDGQQGTPHLSGSSAPGEPSLPQDMEGVSRGAEPG